MKTLGCTLALVAAVGMGAAACSSDAATSPADELQTVRSAQQRDLNPTLSPAELDTLANGEASFAVDMLHAVAAEPATPPNLFLSPHSISIALGMTYAGARGETAAEMKKALHFDLPDDRVHVGFDYLDLELASRGVGASGKDGQPFRLSIANSFWGQKDVKFEAPFLDTLAVSYGSGINIVDFVNETEKSRTTINGWVEKKTENRIKELLKPGLIDGSTRAVLVNAVYFNAAWANVFTDGATAPASFTKADASTMSVAMMHASEKFPYAKGEGYQAVALPYDGGELSLLVVVPDAGTYAAFETGLTGPKMLDVFASLQTSLVNLSFPKLKLESALRLRSPLEALGMKKAFTDGDFSGISATTPLVIDEVVHQTFLALDEKGTEAAAATAVVARETSAPTEVVNLDVNRPFIMGVIDHKTKTLVFLGRVLEPTAD